MKKSELIHWRLQAMLREHTFRDLQYLGVRPDSIGVDQHWYRIGEAEVPVDSITELDSEEDIKREELEEEEENDYKERTSGEAL